ncbi:MULTISPECIES: RNA polymerase sigma factor [Pseudomonadaceae]|uniref:RNA polymerase sigma factor n=1 Tax=Pseudomonadaceae TaxID=135621 RepID=UPI00026025B2|nr:MULTISPECIES: sigma-70 family RNA polymerase sigma factor [Pseudomonadaceae]EIK51210.1 sigma-70 family RNA polymerase sigma factor [Stutzerimonas stutzeri TS44]MBA1238779.1 sigma-70 family RNA polymerase sigma factor [Stutzerimonas kunmingensis]MCQ4246608.1 sigma-70 family RNA polymerase sigma factor [Stutzerimonas decontaminans]
MDTRITTACGAGTQTEGASAERLRSGDREAFTALVREHHQALRTLAACIVGEAWADDALQEAWLAAYRTLPWSEGRANLKTWLWAIVRNQALARLRRERRYVPWAAMFPEADSGKSLRFDAADPWPTTPGPWHQERPEALLCSAESAQCLGRAIAALPGAQQRAYRLREMEGLELDNIAEGMATSSGNVRVLLHRARSALRRVQFDAA